MSIAQAANWFKQAKIGYLDMRIADDSRLEAEITPYGGDPRTLINRLYSLGVGVRCVTFIRDLDGAQHLWVRF